nr:hypothetical protein [Bradyrhizobium nanningense]
MARLFAMTWELNATAFELCALKQRLGSPILQEIQCPAQSGAKWQSGSEMTKADL